MSEVTTNEFTEDGKIVRRIRSFVRREGRLTKGQESSDERMLANDGYRISNEPARLESSIWQ